MSAHFPTPTGTSSNNVLRWNSNNGRSPTRSCNKCKNWRRLPTIAASSFSSSYLYTGMSEEIINRVAQSGLLTLDLEEYYPREEIAVFDLKPLLFREMILKEKEFRAGLDAIDWSRYTGKILAVTCTADAIIPTWAYMLVAVHAQPFARNIGLGDSHAALIPTLLANLQ